MVVGTFLSLSLQYYTSDQCAGKEDIARITTKQETSQRSTPSISVRFAYGIMMPVRHISLLLAVAELLPC